MVEEIETAADYSPFTEDDLYSRGTPAAQARFEEAQRRQRRIALRVEEAGRIPPDDSRRFRAAAAAIKSLRREGLAEGQILALLNLDDPSQTSRLASVLNWLEEAGSNSRAAMLSSLSKRVFLDVVGHGINTVDELGGRLAELRRRKYFEGPALVEIENLVAGANIGGRSYQ